MTRPVFTPQAFELLEALAAHNTKEWYMEHKEAFQAQVRAPFAVLLEAITASLAASPLPLKGGKQTMFRQNKDIRFSKDKSPYKTMVSGLLTPTGTMEEGEGCGYLEISPGGGRFAFGWHQVRQPRLNAIREKIISQPKAFENVLADVASTGMVWMVEDAPKSMPRGFSSYKDSKHAEALRWKHFIAISSLTQEEWLRRDLVGMVTGKLLACQSLFDFFDVQASELQANL